MRDSTFKEKVRYLLEAMLTVLFFGAQTILNAGQAISVMFIPLLPYLVYFLKQPPTYPELEVEAMFFWREFLVGRIIALIGLMVLLLSGIQFLWNHAKGIGLVKTGAYSYVRHPQFTGIIIITVGLTTMVLTNGGNQVQIVGLWLIQILGYIAIARYEETHLLRRFGESFRQYKREVPFIFPVKCPSGIPEELFTILIAVLICFVFLFFPFYLIRIH